MLADSLPRTRKTLVITALLLAVSFSILLFSAPRAQAITFVSGPISVDTTWGLLDNTYVVVGHVTVRPGVTLTILPGTTVRFNPTIGLWVDGSLMANGLPGSQVQFLPNTTILPLPWRGIQFNFTGSGSVTWSIFDRPEVAVLVDSSSPTIANNTVRWTGVVGFYLSGSSSAVMDNTILRAGFAGIYTLGGAVDIRRNRVNDSAIGIEAEGLGQPTIGENTITNITSGFAVGIYTTAGVVPQIWNNAIQGVVGSRGANGVAAGEPGGPGGVAVGILVVGAPWAGVWGNWVDGVTGGRGGNGQQNTGGLGGFGGAGGPAAGIVVTASAEADTSSNTVLDVLGGRGGDGGGGGGTANGGRGGDGGDAYGVQIYDATTSGWWYSYRIEGVTGGPGGNGGAGTISVGLGRDGGTAYGIFSWAVRNADASGNSVVRLLGGLGGNSTASAAGRVAGGSAGDAIGIAFHFVTGSNIIHQNYVSQLTGGQAGRGATGGYGGNATGVFAFGSGIGGFNLTTASANWVELLLGGEGGIGDRVGGQGGGATGFAGANLRLSLANNGFWSTTGGDGGDALDGSDAGRGGDAGGIAAILVPSGESAQDAILGTTAGAPGLGGPVPASYGTGFYAAGSTSVRTQLTVDNATIVGTGNFDIAVDNYAHVTTINTTFDGGRVSIGSAGNLTVRNYVGVNVYWPDGTTLVPGSRVRVRDNGVIVHDFVTSTGQARWRLVTDRVYINSNTATENATEVEVSYLAYTFLGNLRLISMAASVIENFMMDDKAAPTSAAGALPTYTAVLTFNVTYTASDGNGTGLRNVTLWYRLNGSGGWIAYATQPAAASGMFAFVALGDGTYEFTTTADDNAGNNEPGPSANDTWTIVDTTRPGSHVNPLPTYTNTSSFVVSWAPDAGVTDIGSYTIQYRRNGGPWTNWLLGTTLTSATFAADPPSGLYEFRSIATDAAGNVELPPAVNDSWTFVDIAAPLSSVRALSMYQTSLNFTVTWGPDFDTTDIASYRIGVSDNGGAWTVWFATTASTFAVYAGVDGHRYAFRSIATDYAGNVEPAPAGNDTYTIIDVTPPMSAVAALPTYSITATISLSWGPAGGTTDIATYTLEVSDNGGAWTSVAGYVGTTLTSGSYTSIDGHTYAFRTVATDRAGNVEPVVGNNTWTIVDRTPPSVTTATPRGSNVNTTPAIVITFTEPMDRASVEQAFSITPDMNGAFTWSADSRTLTFTPDRTLDPSTTYVVFVDSGARDAAGNALSGAYTFSFTTAAAPGGFGFGDSWWILALIAGVGAGLFFVMMRRRSVAAASKPALAPAAAPKRSTETTIDDVFLLYRDGLLIKHETRRLKPDIDTDILSGMLTAVQQFVKDSFRSEEGDLDELTFGQMHILIGRGKWVILAAMIQGDGTDAMMEQVKRCVQDVEDHQWDQLDGWDGDMVIAKVLSPYVKKLIRGEYA